MLHGVLIVFEQTQRLSQLFSSFDKVRLSLHRNLKMAGRSFGLPLVKVDMAKDVVGRGMIRIQLQFSVQLWNRLCEALHLPIGMSDRIMKPGRLWAQA